MLIQDIFKLCIIPRMEAKFKDICFIADENGNILSTDAGVLLQLNPESNDFTLKFKYSTPIEWVNELTQLTKSNNIKFKYPFCFINSMKVTYNYNTVTINELVFATLSGQNYTSEQRDMYTMKPILWNLVNILKSSLQDSPLVNLYDVNFDVKPHYFYGKSGLYGGVGNVFNDHVDAIEINNLKLRIYKNCTK